MIPPSALTITTVDDRGRPFGLASGQLETARGLAGSVISSPSRMLNVNEQRSVVRRKRNAGDFTPARSGQETAVFVSARNGGDHLVIAHPLVRFLIDGAGRDVGLDPQYALMIERQAIRAAEFAPCMEPLALGSSPSVRPAMTRISHLKRAAAGSVPSSCQCII